MKFKLNISFMLVLTLVWSVLLFLCFMIGLLIVPVSTDIRSSFLVFIISAGKVGVSLLFVLIWLLGWYKGMQYLLRYELQQATHN